MGSLRKDQKQISFESGSIMALTDCTNTIEERVRGPRVAARGGVVLLGHNTADATHCDGGTEFVIDRKRRILHLLLLDPVIGSL